MTPRMRALIWLAVFFWMVGLPGCKGKSPAPTKATAPKQAEKPAAAAGQPAVPPTEEPKVEKEIYNYDVKGRRDPFLSLVEIAKGKPSRKSASINPMENFGVDEIKVIAIARDDKQYYAVITLPDKKSYTIRKGNTLGLFGGKVEEITKNMVLIREQIKDYRGQVKTRDTLLKLRKEGEE